LPTSRHSAHGWARKPPFKRRCGRKASSS